MCTSDNQTLRKRPLEDTAFISIDGSHQMTNPLKKHCTTSDNPSCISLMKATILQRRRQAQADEAVKADQVSSESKPSNAEETLLEEEFQPGPWHVVSFLEELLTQILDIFAQQAKLTLSLLPSDSRSMVAKRFTKNTLATSACVS